MGNDLERRFIQKAQQLWSPNTPLVAGISGGIDSMALYHLLANMPDRGSAPLIPVHVDHGLRAESADDAARLRAIFAERFGAPLIIRRVCIDAAAGESLEAAARRVRYRVLFEEAAPYRAKVVVGHQKNDQAETVLMRIVSGTGLHGLGGIPAVNGLVVRPLLEFSRQELHQYLQQVQVPWIEDSSNRNEAFLRNRLRHRVMPILEDINPQVMDALVHLAARAREADRFIEGQVDAWFASRGMSPDADVLTVPLPQDAAAFELSARILGRYAAAHHLRVSRRHIRQALAGSTQWPGGYVVEHAPDGAIGIRSGGFPSAGGGLAPGPELLPLVGEIRFGAGVIRVESGVFSRPRAGWQAINAKRWPRIWVRGWRAGDRLSPLGLAGHRKKIQDVFVDAKIPREKRAAWPLASNGSDSPVVLAVLGLCTAEEVRAEPGDPVHWIAWVPPPTGAQP
jgi:tRNA(Ile)-lysidine synthase